MKMDNTLTDYITQFLKMNLYLDNLSQFKMVEVSNDET